MNDQIQRKVYLDGETETILEGHRIDGGFGKKGYSAAMRNIILGWFNNLTREDRFRITELGREALRKDGGA